MGGSGFPILERKIRLDADIQKGQAMKTSKLVILDRDGVINHDSADYIRSPDDWHAIPGSLEAIARLCREDYQVVLITNQSGISRGFYSTNQLNRIHQKMLDELHRVGGEISAIFFCPHSDRDQCECRKPKPGMFLELSERLKLSLNDVFAVGDSFRDLKAAQAAGALPVLVKTGKGRQTCQERSFLDPENGMDQVPIYEDLSGFVDDLLLAPGSA